MGTLRGTVATGPTQQQQLRAKLVYNFHSAGIYEREMRLSRFSYFVFGVGVLLAARGQTCATPNSAVLYLDGPGFERALHRETYLLVFFHARDCGESCALLGNSFEDAAKELASRKSVVTLASLTAEKQGISKFYKLDGSPTLLFFRDGIPSAYDGSMADGEDIVAWVEAKTIHRVMFLESEAEVQAFVGSVKSSDVKVVLFRENEKDFIMAEDPNLKALFEVSLLVESVDFGVVNELSIINDYGLPSSSLVAILGDVKYGEYSSVYSGSLNDQDSIHAWSTLLNIPTLSKWSKEASANLFKDGIEWYLFAFIHNSTSSSFLEDPLYDACETLRGTYLNETFVCVLVNSDTVDGQEVMRFLEVTEQSSFATVRVIQMKDSGGIRRFSPRKKPEEPFNAALIREFAVNILSGRQTRRLRSEYPPDPQEQGKQAVKKVVAATFNQTVEGMQDVLMTFYAPWCPYSQNFLPRFDRLGRALRESSMHKLLLGKMDITLNEITNFDVEKFPTIVLWRSVDGQDSRAPVIFEGIEQDRTEEGVLQFLMEHLAYVKVTDSSWGRLVDARKVSEGLNDL